MTNEVNYAPVRYGCNGVNVDFSFPWKIFENEDVIVQIQNKEGNISTLAYGVDYSVEFEAVGGNVKLKNVFEDGNIVIISRDVSDYQSKSFSTSPGFQASEIEKSLDRVSCNLQEMGYNIENFKKTYSAEIDSQIETLENVIEENKQEVLLIQERYEDNLNNQIIELKADVDNKVETVASAADKINKLDESIALCQSSAEIASEKAEIAANKANEILNTKDELEAEIDTKASIDLDNLTETGKKHFLNKTQITNCLLELPRNVKLDLADGTLTLKAGSIVTIPNGFEEDGVTPKFDYVTINNDVYRENWGGWNRTDLIWFRADDAYTYTSLPPAYCFSGETAPTSFIGNGAFWYDTKNNICKLTSDSGATWVEARYSLPFGVVTFTETTGTGIKIIDQIFNGMGYIGSTVWVDKDVKYLIPNGRNEDGTINNTVFKNNSIQLFNMSDWIASNSVETGWVITLKSSVRNIGLVFQPYSRFLDISQTPPSGATYYAFSEKEQQWYFSNTGSTEWVKAEVYLWGRTNAKLSFFNSKQPFHALDYNDKPEISGWGMPSDKYIDLTLGASGSSYTAPANGWITILKNTNGANQTVELGISNSIRYRDTQPSSSSNCLTSLPVKRGQSFYCIYSAGGSLTWFRFIYAEGEV